MTKSIFERYPLEAEPVQTSAGPQSTPYHVYDGHIVLIGGTANLNAVQTLLAGEQVTPVQTHSGRALMGLWAAEEPEANHGPHAELQVSFYVSHRPLPPVADNPFALLHALLTNPEVRQMCYGLWNDTEAVVAYNREILGLSPQLANYTFVRGNGRVHFSFEDAHTERLIARGDVREARRPPFSATVALFRSFGFGAAIKAARTKIIETKIVNPISDVLPRNADALAVSSSDAIVAQLFDPARDHVAIADERYLGLDFRPDFVEHMRGFKLVYLTPQVS